MKSPRGEDANDLHQQGLLGGLLAKKRTNLAVSPAALEALVWALHDAALLPAGIDSSTAEVLYSLAQQTGKQVVVCQPEGGRWIA